MRTRSVNDISARSFTQIIEFVSSNCGVLLLTVAFHMNVQLLMAWLRGPSYDYVNDMDILCCRPSNSKLQLFADEPNVNNIIEIIVENF